MKGNKAIVIIIVIGLLSLLIFMSRQFLLQTFLKFTGDFRTPQYETNETIVARLQSANVYYDRLYKLSGEEAIQKLQEKKLMSVPFINIYNAQKQHLTSRSGSDCKWSIISMFENDTTAFDVHEKAPYDFIEALLVPVDMKTTADTFDHYVLAGWVNYVPKLADSLFSVTNKLKQSLGNRVCFSYINLDHQKSWVMLEKNERN